MVPLKAVLMNVLSLGATYGLLVWVFQEGHLSGLLGFEPLEGIDPTIPLVIFAVVFGLSMDYEVFLLSRIREEWLRTGDNRQSVISGLAHTGRIITSAALILLVVIGAFAAGRFVYVKQIGVGIGAAIALDVTLVRALLVPGHHAAARRLELVGAALAAPAGVGGRRAAGRGPVAASGPAPSRTRAPLRALPARREPCSLARRAPRADSRASPLPSPPSPSPPRSPSSGSRSSNELEPAAQLAAARRELAPYRRSDADGRRRLRGTPHAPHRRPDRALADLPRAGGAPVRARRRRPRARARQQPSSCTSRR